MYRLDVPPVSPMNRPALLAGLIVVSFGTGSPQLSAQRPPLSPVGNYHAHLVSESSARLIVPRQLPAVGLPDDLQRVVQDYERAVRARDAASLAALFVEDGLYSVATGWVRGREGIRAAAANEEPNDRPVRAHLFAIEDSVASITGSLSDGSGPSARDLGKVVFSLRRGADGRWLIASLLRQFRPPLSATSGGVFDAPQLVAQLDSAGIRRALVLSVAYWFGSRLMPGADPGWTPAEEYAKVRAENDWVVSEAARYPSRLIPFCSVHPLKSYALEEVERCGRHTGVRGLKLHLANSSVDLRKAEDVEQLRRVFHTANQQRLPIVVHMRPRLEPYGREDAEIFLRDVIPEAPDVPIQIAHLVGWGGYDGAADSAAAVFSGAIARKDPRTKNLYFDITSIIAGEQPVERRQGIARRIRQLGLRRVVYGSDLTDPRADWARIVRLLPLTRAELAVIAGNVTPYLRP